MEHKSRRSHTVENKELLVTQAKIQMTQYSFFGGSIFLHGWSQILIYYAMPLTKIGHHIKFAWFKTDLLLQAGLLFPRCDDLHMYTWHVSDNLTREKITLS